MATIDDFAMVQKLIKNNGHYFDDPQLVKIVEYTNGFGHKAWGLVYPGEDADRYNQPTEYVREPKTIWER